MDKNGVLFKVNLSWKKFDTNARDAVYEFFGKSDLLVVCGKCNCTLVQMIK